MTLARQDAVGLADVVREFLDGFARGEPVDLEALCGTAGIALETAEEAVALRVEEFAASLSADWRKTMMRLVRPGTPRARASASRMRKSGLGMTYVPNAAEPENGSPITEYVLLRDCWTTTLTVASTRIWSRSS